MSEDRIQYDDDGKTIIKKTYHDVLGIGKAFQAIFLLGVCIGIPMMCALTCTGKWDKFFELFRK